MRSTRCLCLGRAKTCGPCSRLLLWQAHHVYRPAVLRRALAGPLRPRNAEVENCSAAADRAATAGTGTTEFNRRVVRAFSGPPERRLGQRIRIQTAPVVPLRRGFDT